MSDPRAGEVWQEADGCFLTRADEDGWYAFGREPVLYDSDPEIAYPLLRVTDDRGHLVENRGEPWSPE